MESENNAVSGTPTIEVKTTNKVETDKNISEISIKEFLNFLKTAYQVQESVENFMISNGMTEAINWLKQKENQLTLQKNNTSSQTTDDEGVNQKNSVTCASADPLKVKLNEVLTEGLLDSVLPYLLPSSTPKKLSRERPQTSHSSQVLNNASGDKVVVKRRTSDVALNSNISKSESEVEIHVCDEVKSTKKTFFCNQKLLVEKMGYFAEVTQGQRLEDMDISVHCDIGIFEWLMQWVKKDELKDDDWPQLDPQCVIPILVSAAFLQMEPLLNDCLLFCHEHMNEILRTNTNLSCLNDSVLTRLAAMYTNSEVEAMKDRKDKIQSRLFTKLIQSLGDQEPESLRGHWRSLARVFRCLKCLSLIEPEVAAATPCIASCMRLQPDGTVRSLHVRDNSWNINDYITNLHKSLRTWRKVYWRLWGDAHFFFCTACKRYFPSNQIGWCRYHPDAPQFFTLDAQKAPLPIGRYPCCGERAYRFQLLENFSGCHFRQHTVCTQDVKESAIFTMLETYRHLIEEEPPQLLFPERLTRLVARDPSTTDKKFVCKESFWWDGFEIIPPRPRLGLLGHFANRNEEPESFEEVSDEGEEDEDGSSSTTSSESEEGSTECDPQPKKIVRTNKTKRKHESRLWQHNLSARSNQDVQRAYEENTMKAMTAMLNKNIANDHLGRYGKSKNVSCIGGIWTRLESEWKENCIQQSASQQKQKNVFTAGTAKFSKFRGK